MINTLTLGKGDDSLGRYLEEVQRFPLLSPEEELQLAIRFRQEHDLDAAHRLVTAHLRFVVKVARSYMGYGLRLMDLIQEGSIGLMQAVKRFEPQKGFRLVTYALWWIKASIQDFILRSWSLVRIQGSAARKKLFFGLRRARRHIEQLDEQNARMLGEQMGVGAELVLEMDGRLSGRDASLNQVVVEGGDELLHLLPDNRANQEVRMLESEQGRLKRHAVAKVMESLNPRERAILERRVMSEAPATLEELGEEMGISRERVRQIEKRALEKARGVCETVMG